MTFLLLALSQSLAFILSLPFIIDSISVFILPNNISLIAHSVGCDPSQGFF
jgi:hypothetical protein